MSERPERSPGELPAATHSSRGAPPPCAAVAGEELARRYALALQRYVDHPDEPALTEAYEVGRRAFAEGAGVLEIAQLHRRAAADHAPGPGESAAQEFFLEALGPFEMAHRGYRESTEVLRSLNERLEERIRRIGYALHDDVQQVLATLAIEVAALERDTAPSSGPRIRGILSQIDEIVHRVRGLSQELCPTILEDLGLIPALRALAEGFSRREGLQVVVTGSAPRRLPARLALAAYRTVQEALTNVIKHARARRADIRVQVDRSYLRLTIRDDGDGFDVESALGSRRLGLGLVGMRERIASLGGRLEIAALPGSGTSIVVTIPRTGIS